MQDNVAIEGVMEAMHAAILSADYAALMQLAPELDAALGQLPQPLDAKTLERLRRMAERNATTATAAAKGVRAAIRRLNDVRQNVQGLVTYDENGQRIARGGPTELSRRL